MIVPETDQGVLEYFLAMPLSGTEGVIRCFRNLPGNLNRGEGEKEFVYLKGARPDKVLLVAHADTFWDNHKTNEGQEIKASFEFDNGIYKRRAPLGSDRSPGLGADDRAGCAILWLLKDSGHSLLVTCGEENGKKASNVIQEVHADIFDEINHEHQFGIQFDRCNGKDFKCYDVGTDEFKEEIRRRYPGYIEVPDEKCRTDICVLCKHIAGVNLSIGYYNEHRVSEELRFDEWLNTLTLSRQWLMEPNLRRYDFPAKV